MLGFGSLGEFSLGETPTPTGATTQTYVPNSDWSRKGMAVAVIATTFVGFVSPPPVQASIFTAFSQPLAKKPLLSLWNFSVLTPQIKTAIFTQFPQINRPSSLANEPPFGLFETAPQLSPFMGFAKFESIRRAKPNIALISDFKPVPVLIPVVDTHDGVFVKRKSKRKDWRDPIELELEEKAARRAAIELAIYGPEVEYKEPPTVFAAPPPAPPDVGDLAKVMAMAQAAQFQERRSRAEHDDEDDLESILREIL